ncbi:MAG: protein-glutamate O-methyltransferase CheR, partial [Anaerolineales bacterium]
MTSPLSEAELVWLSDFVNARLGLHFARAKWAELERQTNAAAVEYGFAEAREFLRWLVSSPLSQEQIEMLAAHLTISETYFWREPKVFEALRDKIIPAFIRARQSGPRMLRLWCAGCSTGEEAYSIAIVLRELVPAGQPWRITLLATDINPHSLRRAALGVYGDWSFRGMPAVLKEKYLRQRGDGQYEVIPEIRKMVTFAYLNLAEDVYPALQSNTNAMDVIFCRNVLMYFPRELRQVMAQRFYRALNDDGWLMVAAAELSERVFSGFATVRFPGAFIYQRSTAPAASTALVPPPAVLLPTILPPAAALPPAASPAPLARP